VLPTPPPRHLQHPCPSRRFIVPLLRAQGRPANPGLPRPILHVPHVPGRVRQERAATSARERALRAPAPGGKPPPIDGPNSPSSHSDSNSDSSSPTDTTAAASAHLPALLFSQPCTLLTARARYTLKTSRPHAVSTCSLPSHRSAGVWWTGCGSATRHARRLRASDRLHMPTKCGNTTRRVFVLLFHCALPAHFITKLILSTLILTDLFRTCTSQDSLLPPRNQIHEYCEIYFQITHRIPSIELFYIPTHSCTYLL
jgi:hypothetical protein